MQSELMQYRFLPRAKIEMLLANPAYKRLRASYRERFPRPPWYLFWTATKPSGLQFYEWWHDFLDSSIIRKHYLRDGWLSGIDYGDI